MRIHAIRVSRGLTQEQLAERVGSDRKTISRAENGAYPVSVDFVARLAMALGVPSWKFFRD